MITPVYHNVVEEGKIDIFQDSVSVRIHRKGLDKGILLLLPLNVNRCGKIRVSHLGAPNIMIITVKC